MARLLLLAGLLFVSLSSHAQIPYKSFSKRPKLLVMIVIDQFRSDYLTRFHDEFLPAGSGSSVGGFRFLMENSAYYPYAEYDVLQCITCPGHAAILSGSRPYMNGIASNYWYDTKNNKKIYCADDEEFGMSPRRLRSTTVGDEIKNSDLPSKVISVSLKDRAAIMLGGHRSDASVWMNDKELLWATSTYYNKGILPAWAQAENKKLAAIKRTLEMQDTEWGVSVNVDLGLAALKAENLGHNKGTDLLAISLSTHDLHGHDVGPNAESMHQLTLAEDKQISRLLRAIYSHMGSFDDVVIAFTADHGVSPTTEYAKSHKFESARIDDKQIHKAVTAALNSKFGMNKENWIIHSRDFHYYLNSEFVKAGGKVSAEVAENIARDVMMKHPGVLKVFTKHDYIKGNFPPAELGEKIRRSYIPEQSGDLVLIPRPFHVPEKGAKTTHLTGYSYDRTVPVMIFSPTRVKPGVYVDAKVIDIAPTLSFLTSVLPPSMNEGRVLKEILR